MGCVASVTPLLETRGLSKRFGGLEAVSGVDFRLDRGRDPGADRAQRRRQDDAGRPHQRPPPPDAGRGALRRPRHHPAPVLGPGRPRHRLHVPGHQHLQEPLRPRQRGPRRPAPAAADPARLDRPRPAAPSRRPWTRRWRGSVWRTFAASGPGTLAYGHQRLLEVAMALALEPELLILDEPTQGLAGDEIEALCRLVRSIAGTTTVLLIEHNMAVVLELADRVTVMDRGRILAEGTPRRRSRRTPRSSGRIWALTRERADADDAQARPRQLPLRRGPHPAGRVARGRDRRGARVARPERRGQDDDAQGHHGPRARAVRLDHPGRHDLLRVPPDEIPRRGIAYVPQGRRLFPDLTVAENLRMGLLVRGGGARRSSRCSSSSRCCGSGCASGPGR